LDESEEQKLDCSEDWIEWIVRATREVEKHCDRAGIEDWTMTQRRRHWRWAGHVARATDGRWSKKLLRWAPGRRRRSIGRPVKRWSDEIAKFIEGLGFEGDGWDECALDREFLEAPGRRFRSQVAVLSKVG
jgi:hypothetical protein